MTNFLYYLGEQSGGFGNNYSPRPASGIFIPYARSRSQPPPAVPDARRQTW